ncbi:MAG: PDZ domain-containing protein [Thiomicrorhabdus sp.]|jgi:predicted metalloprotease with PDZ domain|nr:PDZ domain-containing protein [Thiomicrorhabdus sp.]
MTLSPPENQNHAIQYSITPQDPKGHLFEVTLTIAFPAQPYQQVRLPNWIPGSYLIRDFSKHLIDLKAMDSKNEPLELFWTEKSTWQFASNGKPVTIRYQVYAWDLSVRGAHFDESHAFFNGTSVFLAVDGQREKSCSLEVFSTEFTQANHWKIATGLPSQKVNKFGFGTYHAPNYDSLIDHPFELGTYAEVDFEACGVPHRVVLTGLFDLDEDRLKADLIKICEYEIKLFGEPAPMQNYLFQVMVTGSDYGGLEHRNSTALMCSRDDLPYIGMKKATDGYLRFLELCSHEYFHTWNVKRIQPEIYQKADLSEPVYTNQLWWFEGITSYYDGLILKRAGLVDDETYLNLLAKQMSSVYRMPGRFLQSVAESSLLTWTKFYQQNENAPNAIISYYTKGSLIALGLDLTIRQQTQGVKSLDDVLLHLWQHFGKTAVGLQEGQIEALCSEVSGIDLTDFFNRYLYGTEDLPFETLFKGVGIEFSLRQPTSLTDSGGSIPPEEDSVELQFGANVSDTLQQTVKITHIWNNRPAHQAGLSAGDELIAINGVKISTQAQLQQRLKRSQESTPWQCHFFRRDELRNCLVHLTPAPADRVTLIEMLNKPTNSTQWLM